MTEYNVSLAGITTLNTFSSWGGVLAIVGISVAIGIIGLALSSLEHYKFFKKIFNKLGRTFTYFKYGLLGWGFIGGCAGIYLGLNSDANNGYPIITVIGVIISLYVLTSVMGVGMKKLVDRVKAYNAQLRKVKKQ